MIVIRNYIEKYTYEKGIQEGILMFSRTLPQIVDEFSVLDSLTMPSDKVINYYYTISISKDEADYTSIAKYIDKPLLDSITTSNQLVELRDLGYSWYYFYYDRNGELFHQNIITSDMYQ